MTEFGKALDEAASDYDCNFQADKWVHAKFLDYSYLAFQDGADWAYEWCKKYTPYMQGMYEAEWEKRRALSLEVDQLTKEAEALAEALEKYVKGIPMEFEESGDALTRYKKFKEQL